MSKKISSLSAGLTFHATDSGALALKYGLGSEVHHGVSRATNDTPTGWAHVALKLFGREILMLPAHGASEAIRVATVTKAGKLSKSGHAEPIRFPRGIAARVDLALASLAWYLNGEDNRYDVTAEGWTECKQCGRLLQAGASIVNGMGPICRAKGKTTDRQERKARGLKAMQLLIDNGRGW